MDELREYIRVVEGLILPDENEKGEAVSGLPAVEGLRPLCKLSLKAGVLQRRDATRTLEALCF